MSTNGNSPGDLYGKAFFDHMSACRENYHKLAQCIHYMTYDLVKHREVLDIGCGNGLVLEKLQELGWTATGIDMYGTSDIVPIYPKDLTWPFLIDYRDLVICTETGEHLPAESANILVDSVCNHALQAIVWSAAPPGQDVDDPSHINLQPPKYWLDRFQDRGWISHRAKTDELRARMWDTKAQHMYCKDSFYILVRS